MIGTLVRIGWLNLKRDYVALGLTFVLPIIFFTIFASIFSGMSGGGDSGPSAIRIVVADEDDTAVSRRFAQAISEQAALEVVAPPAGADGADDGAATRPLSRENAQRLVRSGEGDIQAAVVIPAGFADHFGNFMDPGEPVEVIYDAANPIARHTVSGLLQAAAMTAAPDVLMERGLGWLERSGGSLTPDQQDAVDSFLPFLRGQKPWEELTGEAAEGGERDDPDGGGTGTGADAGANDGDTNDVDGSNGAGNAKAESDDGFTGFLQVKATNARAASGSANGDSLQSVVAYYAAGIGVMFLLFSMAGAGGSLLEEEERGTLERLLTSNLGMTTLLLGNWLFFAALGVVQIAIMFIWGSIIFGRQLDLWTVNHFSGFAVMTVVTAAAAAAFGLVLATLCRSRAQLSGISTIVILIMSAVGGSMVPRFVMPAFMKHASLFTFNGWALDGYLKVFWYDQPGASLLQSLLSLVPQLAVLAALTVLFLVVARVLARRWETA